MERLIQVYEKFHYDTTNLGRESDFKKGEDTGLVSNTVVFIERFTNIGGGGGEQGSKKQTLLHHLPLIKREKNFIKIILQLHVYKSKFQ